MSEKINERQGAMIMALLEMGPKHPRDLAKALGIPSDMQIHTYLDRAIVNLPIYKDEDTGMWYLIRNPEPKKLVRHKTGRLISGMNWNGIGGWHAMVGR